MEKGRLKRVRLKPSLQYYIVHVALQPEVFVFFNGP